MVTESTPGFENVLPPHGAHNEHPAGAGQYAGSAVGMKRTVKPEPV